MTKAAVFKTNKTQAVRLPKDVAFDDDVKTVTVVKQGRSRILTPPNAGWDNFFAAQPTSDDFMPSRDQPADQDRETL